MDRVQKIIEDIKQGIKRGVDGVRAWLVAGKHVRFGRGASTTAARPDSQLAGERRELYTRRARQDGGRPPEAHREEFEYESRPARESDPAGESSPANESSPADRRAGDAGEARQSVPLVRPQGFAVDSRPRGEQSFYSGGAGRRSAPTGGEPAKSAGFTQPAESSKPTKPAVTSRIETTPGQPEETYLVDRQHSRWERRVAAPLTGLGKQTEGDKGDDMRKDKGERKFSFFRSRTKAPNAVLGVAFTTLQLLLFALLVVGMAGVGAVVGIAKAYADTAPVLDVGKIQNQDLTSFIYDSNGKLITTFAGLENRVWAPIDEIPEQLQNAVIAIEDTRFLTHNGVDLKRIVGAFLSNMSSDSSQGGSTITQQLIKNTMITSERTYKRKIQEAWLAMQLETKYKKPQILEAYLNTIPLGESNYGVKAAAQDYFGKTLDKLTLRECAMLAGLTQSPYLYDPRRNTYTRDRMDITNKRTNTVLMRMYELGYIDKTQYEAALKDAVKIQKDSKATEMYDMPYFVEYAIDDITTHLLKSRGLENTSENRSKINSELRTGGYKIYLTVDPQIQKTVEDTLYNWKKYPKMQVSSASSQTVSDGFGGYIKIPQPQAAAVVLDYHTGELKAIVGGRQQPKAKRTLNRAYQTHMPVGSCIKPLAVYAPAIEKGLSPASIIYNVPAPIQGWNAGAGYPTNYSGTAFTGPISMREGLRNSYNVVAAHLLLDTVGLDDSYDTLMKLGIKQTSATNIKKDGSGLALGTSGIALVELTGAFGTFGNKGEYIEPLSFTKVEDSRGGTVLDAEQIRTRTQVFKPSTAWMMVSMMTDVINKGTGTRAKLSGMNVAGKTGTNSDYRGVSFNAITPYYAAAVWVGSDEYKPLYKGATGGVDAAPLWKAFMQKIHTDKKLKNKDIIADKPASLNLVQATVCGVSGLQVTEACSKDTLYKPVKDWFLKGTVPQDPCNLHVDQRICKLSGKIATPYCPEDQVEQSSILAVPSDSIIRKMKPADILKYFPTAVLDYPGADNLAEFTPDNPDYAQYFCPIHTQEWADLQPAYIELVNQANSLVSEVKNKMTAYGVSKTVRDTLNAKIKTVQDIITKGFALTEPPTPAQTVYQNLQNAVNDLKTYANAVLIEPTPTPWEPTNPPDTPPPTASPEPAAGQ